MNTLINQSMKETLARVRELYGAKNQVVVSIEECNELSAILAKFVRYNDEDKAIEETREKVIDEVADVNVILEHIMYIFSIDEAELGERIAKKVSRVARWVESENTTMEQTIRDRQV